MYMSVSLTRAARFALLLIAGLAIGVVPMTIAGALGVKNNLKHAMPPVPCLQKLPDKKSTLCLAAASFKLSQAL